MKYLIYVLAVTFACCFIACSQEEMPTEDLTELSQQISTRSASLCPDPATWTSAWGSCATPLPAANVRVSFTTQGAMCRGLVRLIGLTGNPEYCVYDSTNGATIACGTLSTGSANFSFQTNSSSFVVSVSGIGGGCYSEVFTC